MLANIDHELGEGLTLPGGDLTQFQRDALAVTAHLQEKYEVGPHGLAIKAELQHGFEIEVHHGRLYPNLDKLVDKGLIEKREKDARTNAYCVTPRGERELETIADFYNGAVGSGDE